MAVYLTDPNVDNICVANLPYRSQQSVGAKDDFGHFQLLQQHVNGCV